MNSVELGVKTERHKKVLQALLARIKMSEADMQSYYERWEDAEKQFKFYMPEREVDSLRRLEKDKGNPQYVNIEIPYAYAQMMAAHTYFSSVFLARNPVWQLQGRHGEPEMNVQAMEALIDYQVHVGGMMPQLFVWLHDATKYGLGVVFRYWDEEVKTVSEIVEEQVMILGSPVEGKTEKKKITRNIKGYEGNRLLNVRPFDYLPDTRVPLSNPNRGEFIGRRCSIGWNTIMKRKLSGQYMNIDWVKQHLKGAKNGTNDRYATIVSDMPFENEYGYAQHTDSSLVSEIPAVELVVELIPNEWGLGSTEYPEKWVFTVLDEKVIVEARPYGELHDKFPVEVIETEIEGYELVKRGMLEIGEPLNDVMTWLFNSHFHSVRKTLNGDIVFDPSRVVMSDLMRSNGTGSRIRVTPAAYGQDVRTMIHTVQGGADVTGTHLRDSEIVGGLLQRVMGVTDNMTGAVNPGGRKTATEIRTASSASVNRLKTISEFMSSHGFTPLASQLVSSTQQFYDAEKKFRIAGDQINRAEAFMTVTPDMLAGDFDYVPVDGTLPIDRFAMVNMWAQLLAQVRNFPQIAQEYNLGEIFAWVAQLAGLKNIKQFKLNVMPPGMMPDPNAMALGGQGGGRPGSAGAPANAGGTAGDGGAGGPVIPLPQQIPGMGRAG
jgi:hypothetical protein